MNPDSTNHEYEGEFFEYINAGSLASARVVSPLLTAWLRPRSLLDVGSGAGAWCTIWKEQGLTEVVGVDGEYVKDESLLIPREDFYRRDLSLTFDLNKKFDLVTSLEVAEHVPESSAQVFVENLARHGDRILFSAAVPGQGGEFHVNEQPLSYWRSRFEGLGFRCFDPVRPLVRQNPLVAPWYRYNALFYARGSAIDSLPDAVLKCEVAAGVPIPEVSPITWRTRNAIISALPRSVVDGLVALKHSVSRRIRQD